MLEWLFIITSHQMHDCWDIFVTKKVLKSKNKS